MKKKSFILLFSIMIMQIPVYSAGIDSAYIYNTYAQTAKKIFDRIMSDSSAWDRMALMCDTYGHRFSGSSALNKSLEWAAQEMKKDGFANVTLEEVMVPNWKRGIGTCSLISPREREIKVSALGRSIGTPPGGIEADVLVVKNFEELTAKSAQAKGKIVVYAIDWDNYGQAVQYRWAGAVKAAQAGAVASLTRSSSPIGFDMLHSGVMNYEDTVRKIPHGAITLEDALFLKRLQDRGITPRIRLNMTCETKPDTLSYNVYCDLKGSEKPEDIVALGGHSDCWDYGSGAHDDASGCIAGWQVLKVLKEIGITPRRTMRSVFWVNEENGTRGGQTYAEKHKNEKHSLVFEFDSGVFEPTAIGYTGDEHIFEILKGIEPILKQIAPEMVLRKGGGGVDIGPMMKLGVPGMSLSTWGKNEYFWFHHGPADTPDHVDPMLFNKCIAAIAIATYIYADLPDFLSTK
jgi:carboxypeptidase Q